jgi:hypothetical protein
MVLQVERRPRSRKTRNAQPPAARSPHLFCSFLPRSIFSLAAGEFERAPLSSILHRSLDYRTLVQPTIVHAFSILATFKLCRQFNVSPLAFASLLPSCGGTFSSVENIMRIDCSKAAALLVLASISSTSTTNGLSSPDAASAGRGRTGGESRAKPMPRLASTTTSAPDTTGEFLQRGPLFAAFVDKQVSLSVQLGALSDLPMHIFSSTNFSRCFLFQTLNGDGNEKWLEHPW